LLAVLPRKTPFFGVENEFSPDLLKDGFNCHDRAHTWWRTVVTRGEQTKRGERTENRGPAVALSGAGRYIGGSKISTNRINSRDSGWLASSSISCRV
jgi:hypothetical protein